jgi:cysteine desulfurase
MQSEILDLRSEGPMHPAAIEFLGDAAARGWADPNKLHPESRELSLLLNQAKASFAKAWSLPREWISFTGDPQGAFAQLLLGHLQLGIASKGIIHNKTLAIAPTHRAPIQLLAKYLGEAGLAIGDMSSADLAVWQLVNPETGLVEDQPIASAPALLVDATAPGLPNLAKAALKSEFFAAVTTARSWGGPAGLGVIVRNPKIAWQSPMPSSNPNQFTPAFSPILALLAAVAFEASNSEAARSTEMDLRHTKARISTALEGGQYQVVATELGSLETNNPVLSITNPKIDAEYAITRLISAGIYLDGGSACNANFDSSHVMTALGYSPIGQLRVRIPAAGLDDLAIARLAKELAILS